MATQQTAIRLTGATEAPKKQQSKMETMILTTEVTKQWLLPPCQRPLRVNQKVLDLAQRLKEDGGCISGVITLGTVGGKPKPLYLLDGQHRIKGAELSEEEAFMADVRILDFDSVEAMGEEWVILQQQLVRNRPDDLMRALEGTVPAIGFLREHCDFVGYDNIRRGTANPILSASQAFRNWHAASQETPANRQTPAVEIARQMSKEDYENMVNFLLLARRAWGRDPEYGRLWSSLNLTLCMWLFRQIVLAPAAKKGRNTRRHVNITREQFVKCLMALSADGHYLDWLVQRLLTDRDRVPAYSKIKTVFAKRLKQEGGFDDTPRMPQPAWAVSGRTTRRA